MFTSSNSGIMGDAGQFRNNVALYACAPLHMMHPELMYELFPATPDINGFAVLMQESLTEGHPMLHRLETNWCNGMNTFSRTGEILLCARSGSELVGICGRNIDPYAHDAKFGRVRHLYVGKRHRGRGVGRLLVHAIVSGAREYFVHLNARAPREAFPFYESLGFERIENDPTVTHRLRTCFTTA